MTTTVKERPILFSGPMVRALLDGRKTQTRRVVKGIFDHTYAGGDTKPSLMEWDGLPTPLPGPMEKTPFGQPGDHLWVRERQRVIAVDHGREVTDEGTCCIRVRYEADGAESDWIAYPERLKGDPVVGRCLAYGGFRESSRTNVEVERVRLQLLQRITPADILTEGAVCGSHEALPVSSFDGLAYPDLIALWHAGWDGLNAKRGFGWDTNPWVWVVEFRRLP